MASLLNASAVILQYLMVLIFSLEMQDEILYLIHRF